ncbi:MAG: asparagine synthase (glutamine-hydrolyzing) [Acidobacteria bacterium]|nr:MAG: asparagine synthase (glutamine-hydrolyzing) [Acidobacteriota bacterium]
MCGIAGVLNRDGQPVDRALLARMATSLRHRGPDGEGFHTEAGRPSVGLASSRLAIIDIPGGGQPMSTEDGAFTIVYNGEVFNAEEVRRELESGGHRFRSRCDTEVVLRGYARWGTDVLSRLNGMWAFAIWDRTARRLVLARDRLGVKPLVYADTSRGVAFASEIKALLASGVVDRQADLTALPHYLSAFVVPEPMTLLRGVRRLPAGHYAVADEAGLREVRYWDCAVEEEEDRGFQSYREEVGGLLEDAVRRRLVSDVPLGVFLSGGIDSGLVATLASRSVTEPLRTFTLGFEGSAADERPQARRLATALGAHHTEEGVTAREAASALPDLLAAHDEPSQSLIQGHFVSRLARRDVTVALAGAGGDELFSSYPTHRVVDLLARLDRVPSPLRAALLALARLVPGGRGRRLAALAALEPDARVTRRLLHQTDAAMRENLIASEVRRDLDLEGPTRHLEAHYARAQARHPLNRLLYVYVKTYLVDELLRTLDSMSMLNSLEGRVPLLDYRLVERAMRIPAHHKMSLLEGKVLLRRVASRVLPPGTLMAGKRGFSLPLDAWLRGELAETLRDVLSAAAVRRRGVFDGDAVADLLGRYLDGEARLTQPVMMLFAFEQWARRVLDAPPATSPEAAVEIGSPAPDLSVIVVNWNTRDILRDCLASVARHLSSVSHEVILVDNASSDGSAEMVAREFPRARLIRNPENVGFARANNQAMRAARGSWFLLLNSDARLVDDSVAALLARVRAEPKLGVAHCRLVFEDGRLQHTTYRFPALGLTLLEGLGLYKLLPPARRAATLLGGHWSQDEERDVDWVAGAFMTLPREVFDATGGFSEEYFMYGEDMEWCYRIRDAGYRIRYYPQATVIHRDHSSADLRWGERRVTLCIEHQLQIYAKRHGRHRGRLYRAASAAGSLFRLAYFSARSLVAGSDAEYHRGMRRYSWLSLRAFVRARRR